MNQENSNYGELISSMEVNVKNVVLAISFRLFWCVIFWSLWLQEGVATFIIVILVSLPFLLFPLIHLKDKIELYECGLLQKKRFYTWEQMGTAQFNVYNANAYQWLKVVKMSTYCKVFNVTFLKNPMDTYQKVMNILEK